MLLRGLKPLAAALLVLAGPLAAQDLPRDPPGAGDLAVMGTIPIYWGERGEFADLLSADDHGHWARPVIEQTYRLRPLDYLSAPALQGYSRLLLAQPRGLSAEENVALDAWVRGGGQLLLFADPLMTGHSDFALGDRRRPQDTAMLSPILAHWGLELRFDEAQGAGRQMRAQVQAETGDGVPLAVPTEQAGHFAKLGAANECALLGEGLIAECRLGSGFAVIVADAALLDSDAPDDASLGAFAALLQRLSGNRVPLPASGQTDAPKQRKNGLNRPGPRMSRSP